MGISGTDPTYTVTVTLTDPNVDGTIGIAVAGGGGVTDLAGNPYAGGSSVLCVVENTAPMGHPADLNTDWRLVLSEAIAYLAGWQQGSNPIGHAIRAAYLWQNGEAYAYDPSEEAPLCWILSEPEAGKDEVEEPVIFADPILEPQ